MALYASITQVSHSESTSMDFEKEGRLIDAERIAEEGLRKGDSILYDHERRRISLMHQKPDRAWQESCLFP